MTYYILLPQDTEEDCYNETNQLGEISFDNFWAASGMSVLTKLIREGSEILSNIRIIDQKGKNHSIEEFLDIIKDKKLIVN